MRGGFLIVRCENPVLPEAEQKAQRRATDRHGWGLEILGTIASQHDGTVEAEQENGVYRTTVFLALAPSGKEK